MRPWRTLPAAALALTLPAAALVLILPAATPPLLAQQSLMAESRFGLQWRPVLEESLSGGWYSLQEVAQTEPDSVRRIRPGTALLRSAIVPGWGQLNVGHPFKAVLLAAAGATFVTRTVQADAEVKDLAALRGTTGGALTESALEDEIESWRSERRRWLLWSLGAWLYGMIDAYVDAHLHYFDQDEPDFKVAIGGVGEEGTPPRIWLRLQITLGPDARR
jgi:hypothetical protein